MKYIVSAVVLMWCVIPAVTKAQTTDVAAIIARMEAIIAEMTALQSEFQTLSSSVGESAPVDTPTPAVLGAVTDKLQQEAVYGETNDTIAKIQTLLATDPLIYPYGVTSGFYGPKTEEAIRNLQARFGMKPVGVVGPETSTLLVEYFTAYPDGDYPDDVLRKRPGNEAATAQVQGASVSRTVSTQSTTAATVNTPLEAIYLTKDDGEIVIRVVYKDGRAFGTVADSADTEDIVAAIKRKSNLTEAEIMAVLDESELKPSRDDEDEADEALDDADDALDDAEEAIEEAQDDGEEVGYAKDLLEEAEDLYRDARDAYDDDDFDEAIELAEEAEELAEEAEDAIGEENEKDQAKDAIDEAEDAIKDAEEEIDEAEDDGEETDKSEDLLDEAEDLLEEAEEAYDDEDYDDAIELAEEAEEMAEEAEDAIGEDD